MMPFVIRIAAPIAFTAVTVTSGTGASGARFATIVASGGAICRQDAGPGERADQFGDHRR